MLKDTVIKTATTLMLWLLLFFKLNRQQNASIQIIAGALFLLACSIVAVNAIVSLHGSIRNKWSTGNSNLRLAKTVLNTLAFSLGCVAAISSAWHLFFGLSQNAAIQLANTVGSSAVLFIPAILLYEILFLNKERELDDKVVKQLNSELTEVELDALKNELDPHFVYNSLMPRYYLLRNDSSTAEQYTFKLMQVYQHFLQNRKRDLIAFEEEYKFVENYLFLLRIRFQQSVTLKLETPLPPDNYLIVPLTLQLLIENAIKHTQFSVEAPLEISIGFADGFLTVCNRISKPVAQHPSSRVGLHNLRMRYRYLLNRTIHVFTEGDQFFVRVPLQQKLKEDDVRRYHRG